MLRQIALLLGVCCGITFGAVFDPYFRRYGIFKANMDPLLDVAANNSCAFTSGMKALPIQTSPVMTATQQTIYNAWVNQIDTTIIKNVAITTKKAKWILIAASFQKFSRDQAQLYGLVQFLNITTWGPVDAVVQISREWLYQSSLELTVATTAKGNCKLFDKLLAACSGDSAKYAALSAFIESDLKAIVIDKTKSQIEVTKAVYQAFKTKFFIGAQASWIGTFYSYQLDGYFAFGQFVDVAIVYERQVSIQTLLSGSASTCPFISSMNACLSNSTFNTVQKGFIKQLITYFTAEWSTTVTVEARIVKISMKFSEAIDTSYAYFKMLNIIWFPGYGTWWDIIMFQCQMTMIPSDCGCVVPVFTTTPLPTTTTAKTTTELPTTTTEMPTTTTTEEPTTTTTEVPTTTSEIPTTTTEEATTTTEMPTTTTQEATTTTEEPTTTTTEEPTTTTEMPTTTTEMPTTTTEEATTTTEAQTTTTEMPTTTTEEPTTTTEQATTTTEMPTTTTQEPTTTTQEPTTTTTEEPTTTTTELPTTTTTTEEATTIESCTYATGNAGIKLASGVTLSGDATYVGTCGNSVYYASGSSDVPQVNEMAGSLDSNNCANLCACTSAACYAASSDGSLGLYPYCSSGTCNMYAFMFQGSLTNTADSSDIQNADDQVDLDTFDFKPVTDPVYRKLTKVGCNGCPVDA